MKSHGHFRKITLALSLLAAIAFSLAWQARDVHASAEQKPAAANSPALQGKAAIEHLKQQGLYPALRSALNATLTANFTQLTQITAFDAEDGDHFGWTVAVSGDTVVIGSPQDEPAGTFGQEEGSAYVFVRTENVYTFQRKLTAPNHTYSDYFGLSVAISGDTIVVGAPGSWWDDHGKAYVFVRSGTSWSLQQTLSDGQLINVANFGQAVAISSNTIAIGAPNDNNGSNEAQGFVYVFTRSGTTWSQQQKLMASDGTAYDHLGHSVAINGNTVLAGAKYDDGTRGSAYVFVRSGATWSQQQKLVASDGVAKDTFGASVDLDGNTAVIGADGDFSSGTFQGAAYIFVRSGSSWSEQQKLAVNDLSHYGWFGFDVAINGDTVVVGAPGDWYNDQPYRGSAYVFTRSGATWSQQQKLVDNNGYQSNYFGISVALDVDTLLIGAYRKNSEKGAVIAFAPPVNTPPTINALPVTRSAGSAGAVSNIANVGDAEDAESALQVTVNGGASSQVGAVTLSNLSVAVNGTASGTITTFCTPLLPSIFTLRVTDSGGAFTETILTVTVTANTAPGLSYSSPQTVSTGGATTINPATGPSDNGTINSIVVQSVTPAFSGSISVNPTGVVSVSNATPAGSYNVIIRATDNCGLTTNASFTLNVSNGGGISATNLQFYPLAHPVRLLDTRVGATGCDAPGAKIAAGTSRHQTAAGRTCDGLTIPANAAALAGNVTTVQSGGGYLTLYPSDIAKPLAANSNFLANQILNNVFTVRLGANDGAFKVFVSTDTDVVVDITGYYAPPAAGGLYFHPLPHPVRLLDTRAGAPGCFTPGQILQANSTMTQLGQTTCDGVLIPAGVQALVGNATTTNQQSNGYITLYPADAAQPLAASSNFQAGVNMNAPFMVGLSPSGQFNIFTAATTDLVIDVLGYYSTQLNDANGQGLLFNSLAAPVRLLDTRAGQLACFTPGAQMIAAGIYDQPATGACTTIPAAAQSVVGNATTVNATANGYLTFWPSDAQKPLIATSNYQTGQVFNRHFTVGLGADGAFKRLSSKTTDLVIDVSGYFAP